MSLSLSSLRLDCDDTEEHVDDQEGMSSAGQKRSPPNELERQDSPFQGEEVKRQKATQSVSIVTYRLLCPGSRTGSIIGKGGEIIRELRNETGTKIKIEDPTPECEDRVVTIIGPDRSEPESEDSPVQNAVVRVFDRIVDANNPGLEPAQVFVGRMLLRPPQVGSILGKGGRTISQIRRDTSCSIRILQPGDMPPSAMQADPFAQVVQVTGNLQAVQNGLAAICAQLRINPGKAWSEPISRPPGNRPPPHEAPFFNPQAQPFRPSGGQHQQGPNRRPPHQVPYQGPQQTHHQPPYQAPRRPPAPVAQPVLQHMPGEPDIEIGYRLLIPVVHVGALIGRGGEAIAQLRQRTGARVKVHEPHDTSDQRVVSISGREEAQAQASPAIDALVYCAAPVIQEEGDPQKCVRLVVPSSQVGCVLGKGGSIVTRVRDSTGAMVRVLEQNKGQRRLESGEEVDEVIEIQGLPQSCDSALQAVADLLRQYQIKIILRSRHANPIPVQHSMPQSPVYPGTPYTPGIPYGAPAPVGLAYVEQPGYPNYPPPDVDQGQIAAQPPPPNYPNPNYHPPRGSISPGHAAQQPLQQGFHQGPQGPFQPGYEAAVESQYPQAAYDMGQYSGGYDTGAPPQGNLQYETSMAPLSPYHSPYEVAQPPMSGYGQGIPGVSPMITEPDGTSRVQLAIVGAQVGAVLGRNGTNISQIRQISGAKVRLHEAPREAPRNAASQAHVERQLEISGATGQVQAAMKLVQAFLLAGNVEPLNIPDV
ncbi:hypothetical protein WJX77_001636 [Trebouxia sp. C0004]